MKFKTLKRSKENAVYAFSCLPKKRQDQKRQFGDLALTATILIAGSQSGKSPLKFRKIVIRAI